MLFYGEQIDKDIELLTKPQSLLNFIEIICYTVSIYKCITTAGTQDAC